MTEAKREVCPDCKRPFPSPADKEVTGGQCWSASHCLKFQLAQARSQLENVLDSHAEGTWQACALDAERELASAQAGLAAADRLAQKVMALRADQNSWPKEEEVYEAMVEYRALRVIPEPPKAGEA